MNLIQTIRKGWVVAGVALVASVTTVALAGPAVAGAKGKTVEYVAGAGRIERADVAGRAAVGRFFRRPMQIPGSFGSRELWSAAGGGLAAGPARPRCSRSPLWASELWLRSVTIPLAVGGRIDGRPALSPAILSAWT